ncbi:MAG TPA: cation-translocating P-type ATPase [Candidatus Binatia bacterium]|nr:cation-translocating P-type ATPase [Candidatus Binatia bacterium]
MDATSVIHQLHSDGSSGLNQGEAARRLIQHGANELRSADRISPWSILLRQFKNVLIAILLVATALSVFLGHSTEAIAIALIVLFAVLLGFAQEYRSERALEALRQMAAPTAAVLRDGEEVVIAARDIVPGDIILLRSGDKIPADARLIEAVNLRVEEAALTGESIPIEKQTESLGDGEWPLAERKNMVYAGTAVTYGRGKGLVVATGMGTEFGRTAEMLESVAITKTPLQENLDKVGSALARAALTIVGIIVVLGLYRGQPFMGMLIFGIALAVAVVPEALPAVVTISLALGVQRMAKRNALVRHLPAVETLGSTSVICSDKTGTLTKDEMTVRKLYVAGEIFEISGAGFEPHGKFTRAGVAAQPPEPMKLLLQAAALTSDARLARSNGHWQIKGDPTEGALVVLAAKAGLRKIDLEAKFPRVYEIPFSSEAKRMTTLHRSPSGLVAYAKGAPEIILDSCAFQLTAAGEETLDKIHRETIQQAAREMARQALRVLAVAYKSNVTLDHCENDMVFLGLVGMIDPPRSEAQAAIQRCEQAGIKPVMITGDHPVTAEAVARELGLLKTGRVITGSEMEAMSEPDFERAVEEVSVYARVSPAHKLRVVTALQKKDHVVAMTGDGVNDAPALKKADIGIAMGITGTDVSKEAAAMTLTDDNFASIVAAVEEGRAIFNNIKKYLMYLLSSNIGEIGLMLGAALFGLPLPLTAVQILYVNLATDGLPALALAVDPPEADLMRRPPRNRRSGIFTRPVIILMVVGGLWSMTVNLVLFHWLLSSGRSLREAMAIIFVLLVMIEFFKAYNFRSDRVSALQRPFANRWLNLAILAELAFLVAIVYAPFFHLLLGTFSMHRADWLLVVGLAATITPVLEFLKWLARRGWLGALS